ncbi:UNVERIFIED_CONTAM: hypothetical protein FKN15_070714 [Acipenser sinensis]
MMSEQDLAEMVQIAVEDLNQDQPVVLENHEETEDCDKPDRKRQRTDINCQDTIKSIPPISRPLKDCTVKTVLNLDSFLILETVHFLVEASN